MKRKTVKSLITLFNNFENVFDNKALITAIYIFIKYDLKTFNKKISSEKLEKIYNELQKESSIFNKDLDYRIEKIINNKE